MSWITRNSYTGNGSTTTYTIGFPYIATSDILVYLNNVLQSSGYSFPSSTQIQFTSAPGAGVNVTFQRATDITIINLLTFGSTPSTASLNTILQRVQYIVQEAADTVAQGSISLLTTGQWDAKNHQISNVTDGTLNTDVVNVEQLATKQPLNAILTSIAGLATGANTLPYFSGSNAASQTSFTALARTLLGGANTSAMQSTLGLGSLAPLNTINNSNWSGTALSIGNGGTGQTTAVAGFNALSPLTTSGDILYGGTSGAGTRLGGNTSTARNFLTQTGNGTISAAPTWGTLTNTDVGLGNVENTTLSTWAGSTNITNVGNIGTGTWNGSAVGISKGGTGQTTASAGFNALSPLTTSGDILYGGTSGAGTRLGANTTGTNKYLQSVSSGVPAWAQAAFSDLSGNISTSQMNSGTSASSSTFFRGDGVWATPSGAGTVTNVATSGLATGGPITNTGTVTVTKAAVSDVLAGTDDTKAVTSLGLDAIWGKGTDIASATTLAIPSTGGGYFFVTGTTTITGLTTGLANGRRVTLKFAGALTLTHNATTLILPGSANITTAANDIAQFICDDGTNWRCIDYQKANGQSVAGSVLTLSYDSGDQTITAGGSLTLAHGLGVKPKLVRYLLHCTTAELGYSIGDEADAGTCGGQTGSEGLSSVSDATNINIRYGSTASTFAVNRKDTGAVSGITNGNWKLVVRAYT